MFKVPVLLDCTFMSLHNQIIYGGCSKSCWTIGIIYDLQYKKLELMSNQSIFGQKGELSKKIHSRSNLIRYALICNKSLVDLEFFFHSHLVTLIQNVFYSSDFRLRQHVVKDPKARRQLYAVGHNGEIVQNRKILQQLWERCGFQKTWEDGWTDQRCKRKLSPSDGGCKRHQRDNTNISRATKSERKPSRWPKLR